MHGLFCNSKIASIAVIAGLIIAAVAAVISISFSHSAIAVVNTISNASKVQVGGGDPTNPLFGYKPENVEIKAGQSVVWFVPPQVPAEPHTVTFVFDNSTMILGFLPQNQRIFNPAIIDPDGVTKIYPPNANVTMTGTEKYVNSGWMFPKGAGLPGSSNTFGVTFQKAGTYNYLCLLHPWMIGKVVVH
jgi:plastocyanin